MRTNRSGLLPHKEIKSVSPTKKQTAKRICGRQEAALAETESHPSWKRQEPRRRYYTSPLQHRAHRSPVTQGAVRQRHRLSPFRRLRLRLRSQRRPRTPLLRRSPRPSQTQNRLHPSLSSPIPRTNPPPSPPRIHQGLRQQHLARHHPRLPRTLTDHFADNTSPDPQSPHPRPERAPTTAPVSDKSPVIE